MNLLPVCSMNKSSYMQILFKLSYFRFCIVIMISASGSTVSNSGFKNKIVYIVQVIAILIIIIFSLINLSWKLTPENEKLWVSLLASCLGYLLPNPRLKLRE